MIFVKHEETTVDYNIQIIMLHKLYKIYYNIIKPSYSQFFVDVPNNESKLQGKTLNYSQNGNNLAGFVTYI